MLYLINAELRDPGAARSSPPSSFAYSMAFFAGSNLFKLSYTLWCYHFIVWYYSFINGTILIHIVTHDLYLQQQQQQQQQQTLQLHPHHQKLTLNYSFPFLCSTLFLLFIVGLVVSINGPNIRTLLQNVTSPECRGTAFAFFTLADDLGKGSRTRNSSSYSCLMIDDDWWWTHNITSLHITSHHILTRPSSYFPLFTLLIDKLLLLLLPLLYYQGQALRWSLLWSSPAMAIAEKLSTLSYVFGFSVDLCCWCWYGLLMMMKQRCKDESEVTIFDLFPINSHHHTDIIKHYNIILWYYYIWHYLITT